MPHQFGRFLTPRLQQLKRLAEKKRSQRIDQRGASLTEGLQRLRAVEQRTQPAAPTIPQPPSSEEIRRSMMAGPTIPGAAPPPKPVRIGGGFTEVPTIPLRPPPPAPPTPGTTTAEGLTVPVPPPGARPVEYAPEILEALERPPRRLGQFLTEKVEPAFEKAVKIADVPRQVVGKPVAKAALLGMSWPYRLGEEAFTAITGTDARGVVSGKITGDIGVEVMSFVTDPINVAFFPSKTIQAAKLALRGAKLTPVQLNLLRKAVPQAVKSPKVQQLVNSAKRLVTEEPAAVGRLRMTERGELVPESTFATEAELQGFREGQAPLMREFGTQPVETAGPMLRPRPAPARGAPPPRPARRGGEPPVARAPEDVQSINTLKKALDETYPRRPAGAKPPPPERPTGLMGVPSEPEPPRLPTMRDVEARSKPLPPEVRAEMAGDLPPTRMRLDSFADHAVLWGDRFVQNWWTKMEDVLGGAISGLRRTPEALAVRKAMILRDLYSLTQGQKVRVLILDWVGRNGRVLGLRGTGRARFIGLPRGSIASKVQVREGVDIPQGLAQRLDHIVEHPEKYIITAEQQTAMREADDIFEMVVRMEQREGVDVLTLQQDYWARTVIKTPTGRKLSGPGAAFPKVRPPHAKSRVFGDIEDSWRLGYRYGDPIESFLNRAQAGVDAIANRNATRVVKSLGFKPSEKVDPALRGALATARDELKAARAAATKKGAGLVEQQTFREAEANFDNLKRAMRLEAKRVAERQPQVLGRIVPPEVADEFGRYIGDVRTEVMEQIFLLARANLIWGDTSAMLVQGTVTFFRHNPTWWKATAYSLKALVDEPLGFIAKNLDVIESGVRHGAISPPSEFLLRTGGGMTQFFGRLPGVKQTQRSFEWWIFVAQTHNWKATMRMAKTPDELLELAAVLRKQTGVSLQPGLTRAQQRLRNLAFAPRFVEAIIGVHKDILRGGRVGWEARRTLGMVYGGALAATIGGNLYTTGKLPNLTDPDKPGFFGIRVGNAYVFPLGPFQPFLVAAFRTGRALESAAEVQLTGEGKGPSGRDLQAIPNLVLSKANVGARWALRAGEALGLPLEAIRGEPFRGPAFGERVTVREELESMGPIGPMQFIRGLQEGAPITGLEIGGGRTTVVSPFRRVIEAVDNKYPHLANQPNSVKFSVARNDPEIAPLVEASEKRGLERGTEGALRAEETTQARIGIEQELRLPELAKAFLAGADNGPAIIEQYERLQTEMAGVFIRGRRERREPETPEELLLEEWRNIEYNDPKYFNTVTGERDVDAYFRDRDAAFARLPQEFQDAIEELIRSEDPSLQQVEPLIERAKELRSQYFDLTRWQRIDKVTEERILEVQRRAEDKDLELKDKGVSLPMQMIYDVVGFEMRDPQLAERAWLLTTKVGEMLRNPARDEFLIRYRAELERFFPELIRESLRLRLGQEEAMRQSFQELQQEREPALAGR